MTKNEFIDLTSDLPSESELYFCLNCIYMSRVINEDIGIKSLKYETSFNGGIDIILYDN